MLLTVMYSISQTALILIPTYGLCGYVLCKVMEYYEMYMIRA